MTNKVKINAAGDERLVDSGKLRVRPEEGWGGRLRARWEKTKQNVRVHQPMGASGKER